MKSRKTENFVRFAHSGITSYLFCSLSFFFLFPFFYSNFTQNYFIEQHVLIRIRRKCVREISRIKYMTFNGVEEIMPIFPHESWNRLILKDSWNSSFKMDRAVKTFRPPPTHISTELGVHEIYVLSFLYSTWMIIIFNIWKLRKLIIIMQSVFYK